MKRSCLAYAVPLAALLAFSSRVSAQDLPEAPPPPRDAAPALLPAPAITPAPIGWRLPPANEPEQPTYWYGWQTILAALPFDVLYLAAYSLDDWRERDSRRNLMLIGFTGQLFAGPIVHWSHGYVGKGFASLGIGIGVPLVLAPFTFMIASAYHTAREDIPDDYAPDLAYEDAQIAIGIGALIATGIDVAVFADEPSEKAKPSGKTSSRALPVSFAIAPMLDKERIGLSVAGRF